MLLLLKGRKTRPRETQGQRYVDILRFSSFLDSVKTTLQENQPKTLFINESGLYSLILSFKMSKKIKW